MSVHQQRQRDGARLEMGRMHMASTTWQFCRPQQHYYSCVCIGIAGSILFISQLCPAAQRCPATHAAARGCHHFISAAAAAIHYLIAAAVEPVAHIYPRLTNQLFICLVSLCIG
jgi:hypothetical protein